MVLAVLLVLLFFLPGKVYAINPPLDFSRAKPIVLQSPNHNLTKNEVRAYVEKTAKEYGVNPTKALWIIDHESQDCWQQGRYNPALEGKEPNGSISFGCWQFNNRNSNFDIECATDLPCSTEMAMRWILAGKINKWTTYSERFLLYPNQNPPI